MTARHRDLTALETAVGAPLGIDPNAPQIPAPIPGETPRAALERSLRAALTRPPCVVPFSGGRDSSAVLAAAVELAQREGLELPVAYTSRYPGLAETSESEWQEEVIAHVGAADWVRRDLTDELDWVGPYAQADLSTHGLVWPPNSHFFSPAFEVAAHGSLVTGVFGDEVFSQPRRLERVRAVLERRSRPELRDVARIGLAVAPVRLREAVARQRGVGEDWIPGWVRPDAADQAVQLLSQAFAARSIFRRKDLSVWWRLRYRTLIDSSMARLSERWSVRIVNPFGDAAFITALTSSERRLGMFTREDAMRVLFGEVLPARTVKRLTKATFDSVGWNRHSAAFVADWSGSGIDPDLVDIDVLRSDLVMASTASPARGKHAFQAAVLLQAAWLAGQGVRTPISPQ